MKLASFETQGRATYGTVDAAGLYHPVSDAFQQRCADLKAVIAAGGDFTLQSAGGPVSLKDFRGKLVMMFFGYTQCPDVCPTSMVEMARIRSLMGKDGERVQCLFVTLDPGRDTPEMLKAYMENFDPSFLALVPKLEDLPALTKEFKVYYKQVAGPTPTSYTLDHTAGSYVYDTQGKLRLFTRYGTAPELTVADLQVLLKPAG